MFLGGRRFVRRARLRGSNMGLAVLGRRNMFQPFLYIRDDRCGTPQICFY